MPATRLLCAFALLHATSASAALPVTTSATDTDTGGEPDTAVIVLPADGATFSGTPDAKVPVTAEFTGSALGLDLSIDDKTFVDCPLVGAKQCQVDLTLTPGTHELRARALDQFDNVLATSEPITVEVTMETATTTGDTAGSSGSDGSTGDGETTVADPPDTDKGCDCDADGRPGPALALVLGALALARRRRSR